MNSSSLKSFSILHIVIAMMALSLIFSALFTALISSNRYYNAMSSYSSDKYLPELLGRIEGNIHSELNSLIGMSRAMGQNTYLTDWVVAGENPDGIPQVQQSLQALKNYSGAIRSFFVSKSTYHYYTSVGLKETINDEDEPWFDAFLSSGKDHAIFLGLTKEGVMRAYINVRVEHNGQAIGATGLSFEVKQFNKLLAQANVGEGGQVFLIDQKGKVAVHQNSAYVGKSLNQIHGFNDIAPAIVQNKHYYSSKNEIDGQNHFISALNMGEINFSIVAVMPTKPFTDAVYRNAFFTVLGNLLIALFFLAIMALIIRKIASAINNIADQLEHVSVDNDLSIRLDGAGTKEVVKISRAYNKMAENFTTVIDSLSHCSHTLSDNSDQLQQITAKVSQGAQTQVLETTKIMQEVDELQLSDDEIKQKVDDCQAVTTRTKDKSDTGQSLVEQTHQSIYQLNQGLNQSTDVIGQLEHDTANIAGILAVISGIADQTNLLALNAAIEAARAGEQGRGFAVVADEVRNLAGKTQNSTGDIQIMVSNITKGVAQTVDIMGENAKLATDCMEKSTQVSSLIHEVNSEIDNINALTANINDAVLTRDHVTNSIKTQASDINQIANQSSQSTEQSTQTTDTLSHLSHQLSETVDKFKL